ncbi:MAG: hypothetical protein AB7G93_05390 [Bdellovibrionales bacterium]
MSSLRVWSAPLCLPEMLSAQLIEEVSSDKKTFFARVLYTQREETRIATRALLQGKSSSEKPDEIHLKVLFDPDFDGVSLPYNLFAVLIVQNGQVSAWWDFTRGCTGPGVGIFPGGEFQLPPVKLIGGGSQSLQIMVWGKL